MADFPIVRALTQNWWTLVVRGIFAILFGLLAFIWPGLTLLILVVLFGAYALVDGVTALVLGGGSRTWSMVLVGLLGIAAGVLTFLWPGITALVLLYLIAAWAITSGIFEIIAAIAYRKELTNEGLLILSGAAALIFGILLIVSPGAGALSLAWLIGTFAIIRGILLLSLGFRLHGVRGRIEHRAAT